MVKLDCHFGQQQWLALKGHAHAGSFQQRQIICPIANGYRVDRINAVLFAIIPKIGGFGIATENWRLKRTQNFAIADMYMIGVMVMKPAKRGNWAGDDVKSIGHEIAFYAICSHRMNKFDCA